MAMQSADLHESGLNEDTIDRHRAIVSLMEELEAVDWYDQRADATKDDSLREILVHNRDEEKEHASMLLEWLRRRDQKLDQELRTYLFSDKPILEIEETETGGTPVAAADGSLGIGSLHGEVVR